MSTYLDKLPDVTFAEKDTAVIEAEVLSFFEKEIGKKLYSADPKRLFLAGFIKYLVLQRSLIDFSGKQNLLRYSSEGFLQNIAALVGTDILEPSAAGTTLKFTLSTPLPGNVTIKKGTRATPGNKLYFATVEAVDIPAGELSAVVGALCTEVGTIGNGYFPGQVNQLTDPYPYSCTVENISITQGGADREDLDAFRERVRIAPESYSSAGAQGAYTYWAKKASQLITDVSVTSTSPGVVEIVPLLKGGEMPGQALLDDVYAECSADNRRPLTDKVIVRPPEIVSYSIDICYYISRGDSSAGLNLQAKANQAVQDYIVWQKSALGRDINPSKLIELVMCAGVKRVVVTSPEYKALKYSQIADAAKTTITDGGFEDD